MLAPGSELHAISSGSWATCLARSPSRPAAAAQPAPPMLGAGSSVRDRLRREPDKLALERRAVVSYLLMPLGWCARFSPTRRSFRLLSACVGGVNAPALLSRSASARRCCATLMVCRHLGLAWPSGLPAADIARSSIRDPCCPNVRAGVLDHSLAHRSRRPAALMCVPKLLKGRRGSPTSHGLPNAAP